MVLLLHVLASTSKLNGKWIKGICYSHMSGAGVLLTYSNFVSTEIMISVILQCEFYVIIWILCHTVPLLHVYIWVLWLHFLMKKGISESVSLQVSLSRCLVGKKLCSVTSLLIQVGFFPTSLLFQGEVWFEKDELTPLLHVCNCLNAGVCYFSSAEKCKTCS